MPDELDKTVLKVEEDERTLRKEFVSYLVIADGPKRGSRFYLKDGENLLGRSPASVVMVEDQSVSRSHAVITLAKEGVTIKDLGSKNGTLVNGQRIAEPVTIGHGDIIQLGVYSLRLITRAVDQREELAPLPPELEGKTVMMTAPPSAPGEATAGFETPEPKQPPPPREPKELPERPRWALLLVAAAVLVVGVGGGYLYWRFFWTKAAKVGEASKEVGEISATQPISEALPKTIPVFLDFASSPLPARAMMDGKEYGLTPVKANVGLEVDKTYEATGVFTLEDLGGTVESKVSFTVKRDEPLIPLLFRGPIGIIKVDTLPRNVQIYIEGYYENDPFKAHPAKLTSVVFGKPVYVPYGRYIIELREPKDVGGTLVEDIKYRREVKIVEDNPIHSVSVVEDDLTKFPSEITSIPSGADVYLDEIRIGQTPFQGTLPLGEHRLTLRKEGYFEHNEVLKVEINTPYSAEITLKTTVAGEHINSARGLIIKGMYQDAISELTKALESGPTLGEIAHVQYLLGSCYLSMGDVTAAKGYFEQALASEEFKYSAMLGLVRIYHSQGDSSKAITMLVDTLLNAPAEVKKEASQLFSEVSPLRSIIYIYTDPPGAKVILNDKPVEHLTPVILHEMGLGNYKIRIQKVGYQPQDFNINLSVAEFNPIIVKLKPIVQ